MSRRPLGWGASRPLLSVIACLIVGSAAPPGGLILPRFRGHPTRGDDHAQGTSRHVNPSSLTA